MSLMSRKSPRLPTSTIKELILRRKEMVTVHLSAIPCEPYAAHKVQGKPYFCNICPFANDIVYVRFEDLRTFQDVFMSTVKVFMCFW